MKDNKTSNSSELDRLTSNSFLYLKQELKDLQEIDSLLTHISRNGTLASKEQAKGYLAASDALFQYNGNIQKVNDLLDAQYQISQRNSISMKELAKATQTAGNLSMDTTSLPEKELTALLGAGIAASGESGDTVARSLNDALATLSKKNRKSSFNGEIIDEDKLKRAEERCRSLGVELECMKDGMLRLREPLDILKAVAEAYQSLPSNLPEKGQILEDIGGTNQTQVLDSLFNNWGIYEKMLLDYEGASGSVMAAVKENAKDLEEGLGRLEDAWKNTMSNISASTEMKTDTNGLEGLLSFVEKTRSFLDTLDALSTIPNELFDSEGLGLTVSYSS